MRHLITLADLKSAEVERIFAITEDLKTKCEQGLREPLLPGRVMALLFEKPSLRTRVSFEAAMAHLGGNSLFLGEDVGWNNGREAISDFARVLSEYCDVIVMRTRSHQRVTDVAQYATCSVINGLTDADHPCQALADVYTLRETFGKLKGLKVTFVGDGNNVARALARCCGKVGMKFHLAAPQGYEFSQAFLDDLKADVPQLDLTMSADPREAVRNAQCIYTDVWTSMGQEAEMEHRRRAFSDYQVNAKLMALAPKDAVFLHCLPARRGEEVTDEVIDSKQSLVVREAANRMHVQKGVLAWILGPQQKSFTVHA